MTSRAFGDVVRRVLMFILLLGLVGAEVELLFLKHTDGAWQPLVLIGAALLVLVVHAAAPGPRTIRAIQARMVVFVLSGVVGILQHYRGNVDLNRGTDAEFLLIPGAGQRMLREFKEYRPWTSFDQFQREIGKYFRSNPGEVVRLEQYVFIAIDLNTASDSLMMTFAGINVGTPRWIREFKEYRPWTSAEQFEREISKYVRRNPKEVSRLSRYVVIK